MSALTPEQTELWQELWSDVELPRLRTEEAITEFVCGFDFICTLHGIAEPDPEAVRALVAA